MISNQNTSTDPQLSREEAIEILNTPDENLDELIARAEKLRRKYKGNHVSIHILTNARSGNCSQDCAYCAQSCRSKADIDKYKWVADEKLYADNDFVNEHHLSRHCIGLSGMKFTDAEIEQLAGLYKNYEVHITDTNPFLNAQVCAGGLDIEEVDGQMQVKKYPGLFVTGELLDVDGICGGYNLHWAFATGTIAGKSIRG